MKPCTRKIRFASAPNAEATIAAVRELAERATLRPASRKLRCLPLRPFCPPVAPAPWQFRRDWLLEIANRKSPIAN